MRLRYLHLRNYPPIDDIRLVLASSSPLGRECAIRFVVGLNGSGKSNLLRAVAELFLALADQRLPPFPATLIYELGRRGETGHRSFVLDVSDTKSAAALWVAEGWHWPDTADDHDFRAGIESLREDGQREHFRPLIAPGSWPQRATIALPKAVLAYTTGAERPWLSVLKRNQEGQDWLETVLAERETPEERPPSRDARDEMRSLATDGESADEAAEPEHLRETGLAPMAEIYRRPILLNDTLLKCALLCVALPQAFKVLDSGAQDPEPYQHALQELLERGGWHHLVSVGFHGRFQPDTDNPRLLQAAHDWWLAAAEAVRMPPPNDSHRTLWFDLKGRFDDLVLRLRCAPVPDPGTDSALKDLGVMRYGELSDGEQMFTGRMALLYLLQGQDDAILLLDEPETHFNDLWKRDVIAVVDDALGHTSCEVIVATHAALVLTDALKDELVVLARDTPADKSETGSTNVRWLDGGIHTFGATGDHPLRDIFGAPDTVGRRASRLLEVLLVAASQARSLDACWAEDGALSADVTKSVLEVAAQREKGLSLHSVGEHLRSIERLALHFGAERPLSMVLVLEAFIPQIGPGYFQVELKRTWHCLHQGDQGHAS